MTFYDELGRELSVGDVVLTSYRNVAVVAGFTPKKVKLASFGKGWDGVPDRVSYSTYEPHSLMILRYEDFADCKIGYELDFIKSNFAPQ